MAIVRLAMPERSILRAREILRSRTVPDLPDASKISRRGEDGFFGAMLEAAFLVAAADGELSKEEIGSLVDVVADLGDQTVTPTELASMVDEFSALLDKDGRLARIGAVAAALPDPSARREVLGFAGLIAICDHDLAPSELYVLHALGKAFGFDAQGVNAILRSLREAVGDKPSP